MAYTNEILRLEFLEMCSVKHVAMDAIWTFLNPCTETDVVYAHRACCVAVKAIAILHHSRKVTKYKLDETVASCTFAIKQQAWKYPLSNVRNEASIKPSIHDLVSKAFDKSKKGASCCPRLYIRRGLTPVNDHQFPVIEQDIVRLMYGRQLSKTKLDARLRSGLEHDLLAALIPRVMEPSTYFPQDLAAAILTDVMRYTDVCVTFKPEVIVFCCMKTATVRGRTHSDQERQVMTRQFEHLCGAKSCLKNANIYSPRFRYTLSHVPDGVEVACATFFGHTEPQLACFAHSQSLCNES